jgi:hypothetical protein
MKLNRKHAFVIIAIGFLFSIPAVTAASSGSMIIAQDIDETFFFNLIENGAELVFTAIDEQGAPAVVYGQLGVPDSQLGLGEPMYDGCMVMALLATQGELLEYVLDLVGGSLFNFTDGGGGGTFFAQQFGGGGFNVTSIFDMLGTDFNLLINVFFDLEEAQAQTNMAAIRTHLHTEFAFDFAELLNLRIDEDFLAGIIGDPVDLPFTALDLFIYQVTNPFEDAVDSVLNVMDQSGFMASIDRTVFTEARASGAGLLAVPDMGNLMDLIEGFGGGTPSPASFLLSQMPALDGPLAIAAAGYIGDQILSTSSDELNIFEDLLGKSPTGFVNGMTGGQSLVAAYLPENMNLTSYSPEDEALGLTFYDENASIVFWNATTYTDVPDYTISFVAGDFPPLVTISRTFDPATAIPGGSTQVTVTVTNEGTEPIYNVTLTDASIAGTYPHSVNVTGSTSESSATVPASGTVTITYTVTFAYEGVYAFAPATLEYDHGDNTYNKKTHIDGFTVSPDPLGLLQSMFLDGMPFTALMVGAVVLGAIFNIVRMRHGKGGSGTYQV